MSKQVKYRRITKLTKPNNNLSYWATFYFLKSCKHQNRFIENAHVQNKWLYVASNKRSSFLIVHGSTNWTSIFTENGLYILVLTRLQCGCQFSFIVCSMTTISRITFTIWLLFLVPYLRYGRHFSYIIYNIATGSHISSTVWLFFIVYNLQYYRHFKLFDATCFVKSIHAPGKSAFNAILMAIVLNTGM